MVNFLRTKGVRAELPGIAPFVQDAMFTQCSLVLEPTNRSELPEYKRQFYAFKTSLTLNEHLIKALHLNSFFT